MDAHGEQRGVVGALGTGLQQTAGEAVAQLIETLSMMHPQEPGETAHATVSVNVSRLDQAVGVEDQEAPVGNCQLHDREGWIGHTERRIGGGFGKTHYAVAPDDGRRRVTGAGDRAAAGHRVVDRIQAGREEPVVAYAVNYLVDVTHDLIGRQIEVREGLHGGAQPPHDDRFGQAMSHDVTDHQGDPAAGQRHDVIPVTADARARPSRQIPGCRGHRRQRRQHLGQQIALQRLRPGMLGVKQPGTLQSLRHQAAERHQHGTLLAGQIARLAKGDHAQADDLS